MEGCILQLRFNGIWLILIALVGMFGLLYLWFTLFPGKVSSEAWQYFSTEQINQGREYNREQQLVFIISFLVQAAFLVWFVFGGRAAALSRWIRHFSGGSYWGHVLLYFLAFWLLLQLINLPFSLYSSYFLQHQWGFSTQTLGGWWADYFKSSGLELLLSIAGVILFFWSTARWPGAWWLVGAGFISLWIVLQSFLWPVIVSPLFNRFEPAKSPVVLNMVHDLSRKARLPVDQVLVMDASSRTTKANAYFTGLGRTKRIVLYDTLLKDYPQDEIKAVVAHEMAHWSQGHIIKGIILGVIGNFLVWGLLFVLLRLTIPPSTHYPAHTWPVIILFFMLISFAESPLQNYISRSMEKEADRVSVMLTGDVPAAVRLQVDLSAKNFSDVSPPAFIEWFSYSHPSAVNRIELLKREAKP